MSRPQSLKAPASASKPKQVGTCDRCSDLVYYDKLSFQFQYLGNSLKSLNILVCPKCLDKPSEFLRPAILGPEPVPPRYPRPTSYGAQNEGGTPAPSEPLYLSILGDGE